MVDVSGKSVSSRSAIAQGSILMRPETLALIMDNKISKGDVLTVARLAGIMGAKRTSDLIPLCHPLALTSVKIELYFDTDRNAIDVKSTCKIDDRTGVEMEALTAVSITALTIYDMCKAVDRSMRLTNIRLTYKEGGKTGAWRGK